MKVVLDVEGMSCDGCRKAVTRTIHNADPAATVTVDLANGMVEAETSAPPSKLAAMLSDAGYEARIIEPRAI